MKKNVANQYLSVTIINKSTGDALVGAGVTVRRILNGSEGAITGTVSEPNSDGHYLLALSQADTNGDYCSYFFTTVSGIPVCLNVHTDYPQTGDAYTVANNIETDTQDIQGRIPAALTANGNIKASLVEILTTALTETAGLIAAGFKKFFNVSSPTGTLNSLPAAIPDATGGLAIVGSQMNLKDDAITSGKFDESTAFPQTEADSSAMVIP